MLIKSLTIENYRCYQHQELDFERLTAILGRNGGGKTTILSALEEFYNTKSTISIEDFFNRGTSQPIKIRVVFGDFRDGEEKETFKVYIQNGLMPVTKVITWTETGASTKYLTSTQQIPQFARVLAAGNKTSQVTEFNLIADSGELPGLERLPVRGADLEGAIAAYEQAHPEAKQWIESEAAFFGAKNVGAGRLDKYTKFVRIPAVRDVMNDVTEKKGSPINLLLDMVVLRRIEAREDVRKLRQEFETRIKEVYSPENLAEIKDLERDLNDTLKQLAPNAGVGLDWGEAKIPEVPLPAFVSRLIEDGFEGSVDRKGHGVQRALVFSLLQNLAVAQPREEIVETIPTAANLNASSESQPEPQPTRAVGADLILAIDEPELYQHPLRSRHLANVLHQMSETESRLGGRNQIIFTTHSPYFIDLQRFSEVRIVRKCQPVESGTPPCSSIAKYSLEQAAQEMARINAEEDEEVVKKYTASSFFARTYPIMTTIVNEGFFADVAVLVEGLTEAAFFSTVATQLGKGWIEKGVAIIPVEGKNKIDRAGVIFKGLGIPTYIVFDGDERTRSKAKEGAKEAATNKRLLRLVNETNMAEFPADGAHPQYACFADEIEKYCENHLGKKDYDELITSLAQEYSYDRPSDVLKNFDIACEFVHRVYRDGRSLPLIEQITDAITSLNSGIGG